MNRGLLIFVALMTGVVLALVLAVGLDTRQAQDQQQQRFLQWEQCEFSSNGSGGAGDPCGPMPVP